MKNLRLFTLLVLCVALLGACRSGKENAFNKSGIQKRKYTKGYHANLGRAKAKTSKAIAPFTEKQEEIAQVTPLPPAIETGKEVPLMASAKELPASQAQARVEPTKSVGPTVLSSITEPSTKTAFESIQLIEPKTTVKPRESDDKFIIALLLAILIPPLGCYFWEGSITTNFWVTLILFLVGIGPLWFFVYSSIFWMAAIIWAVLVVADVI